ncbi:MAG: M20/M25/M40 family metallo-hydrolase [Oscillospiraceae bacterium]|nr:M20/M25/M40 family metallo-hydrolase [Oscillospiraceae bacterium]
MEIKSLIEKFSHVVSVTGYEYMAETAIKKIIDEDFQGVFDEVSFDKLGSCRLVKKGVRKIGGVKKIMLDAHIDQIGLVVTEILDGGFLRVKQLGGIDNNILIASEFYVYTKSFDDENPFIFSAENRIPAIAVSVPPHLKKTKGDELPKIEDLYLDTGYDSKKDLEKIVKVGCPVSFKSDFLSLENNLVSSVGLDDRLCALTLMLAVKSLKSLPDADVHIVLSVSEETGGPGAATAAFDIQPDFAAVLDVGFAKVPEVDAGAFEICKGAGISYSAATNMNLTKKVIAIAKEKKIPIQPIAEPRSTGTNADEIQITGEGIPCVLISVPVKNMHTFNEICSVQDVESTAKLVAEIIENAGKLI